MNILETIVNRTKERIQKEKQILPLTEVRRRAEERGRLRTGERPEFEKALRRDDFPYRVIASEYEAAGAAAISCLTEPYWFLGKDRYLEEIVETVSIPVLRKDFTCDEYMIYQAKAMGASAVLLICSVLDDQELKAFSQLSAQLGLSALVETHSEKEIERAKKAGALILGVNNRNLKDFSVDLSNSTRLRELAGPDTIFVSESGIRDAKDIQVLQKNGTDAVLIGEMLMRAPDRKQTLRELRQAARQVRGDRLAAGKGRGSHDEN